MTTEIKPVKQPMKQTAIRLANKAAGWGVVAAWAPTAMYAITQGEPTDITTYIIPTFCAFAGWAAAVGVDAIHANEAQESEAQENAALDAHILATASKQAHAEQLELFDNYNEFVFDPKNEPVPFRKPRSFEIAAKYAIPTK